MRRGKNAISRTLEISSNSDYAHACLADGNIFYQACHGKKKKLFGATVLVQSPRLTEEATKDQGG